MAGPGRFGRGNLMRPWMVDLDRAVRCYQLLGCPVRPGVGQRGSSRQLLDVDQRGIVRRPVVKELM
jgi:hypothetical protein